MDVSNRALPSKLETVRPDEILGFYQSHLDRVSRSFAFCIKELEGKFRLQVSLCYLLFRVLDTVEDAQWATRLEQETSFLKFHDFVEKLPNEAELASWTLGFPQSISTGEYDLLQDAGKLFVLLHAEPTEIKNIIKSSLRSMARGMLYFCQYSVQEKAEKNLILNSIFEVNRYCFFVAGIVGEMLEQLFQADENQNSKLDVQHKISAKRRLESFHFGLFLQKINVLKDQIDDQKEGRFLVPNREAVLLSLKINAYEAFEYLISTPLSAISYRLFCAWSLYLGLASLPYIEEGYRQGRGKKIPRLKAFSVFQKVRGLINDNAALEVLFYKLIKEIKWPVGEVKAKGDIHLNQTPLAAQGDISQMRCSSSFADFGTLYPSEMSEVFLRDLGLIS